jgi:D-alanyl-D-alanine carboxypeptidase/D-alanyl-D-alanine-endopeptidase (penicillin-binding protein 4)
MRGTILDDRVEAKTGTLANVRSLSGYLETTTGKHVVFAILANNFIAPAGQVDAIVERVLSTVASY